MDSRHLGGHHRGLLDFLLVQGFPRTPQDAHLLAILLTSSFAIHSLPHFSEIKEACGSAFSPFSSPPWRRFDLVVPILFFPGHDPEPMGGQCPALVSLLTAAVFAVFGPLLYIACLRCHSLTSLLWASASLNSRLQSPRSPYVRSTNHSPPLSVRFKICLQSPPAVSVRRVLIVPLKDKPF